MFVTLGSYQSGHLAVDDSDLSFPSWSRSLPLSSFANSVYTLFGMAQCLYSCTAKSYCVIWATITTTNISHPYKHSMIYFTNTYTAISRKRSRVVYRPRVWPARAYCRKRPTAALLTFCLHVLALSCSSILDGSFYLSFLFCSVAGADRTFSSVRASLSSNLEKAIKHERTRWFLIMD